MTEWSFFRSIGPNSASISLLADGQAVLDDRCPGYTSQTVRFYTENEEPQPQVVVALGFLITNWDPSNPSV